jgi:predicted phosphodiesterase
MRFHVLSDLHLEFGPFNPPAVEADAVILAGDIHPGRNGLKWALATFPNRPVIYVLGNHECYGQTLPKLTMELHEESSTQTSGSRSPPRECSRRSRGAPWPPHR